MSKIKILPDILSNKIAAGEVVERPASVVKELVENAIDAQSAKITVEIETGGRSLIRVSDDGQGMNHDDALLALERYATSKIYTDEDLYAIATLGFRGEALPSIAAVSKFTLTTNDQASSAGTEVYVEGGKILKVSETGAPQGTMISVSQLFFNIPARRKFLKAVPTEMGHIADIVSCAALAWPKIQFKLIHNQKLVKNWPPAEDPFDRALDVLGFDIQSHLHPIHYSVSDIRLTGWASDPSVTRTTSQKIFIFVNGRYVRDRGIAYALFEGYKGRIMKGQFPMAVLFLSLPPEQVDVNVHPAKSEVRFAGQPQVYEAVRSAVEGVWKSQRPAAWPQVDIVSAPEINERIFPAYPPKKLKNNSVTELFLSFRDKSQKPASDHAGLTFFFPQTPGDSALRQPPEPDAFVSAPVGPVSQKTISECTVIGQFHNTYILCEQGADLVVIDQHAAHERIVYERLKRQRSGQSLSPIQTLMMPETIELSFREAAIIDQMIPDLNALGIEMEHFGGNTFVVKSVPSLLAERQIKPLIIKIAETMDAVGYHPGASEAIDECLILMACHGAIRAHQTLSVKEIKELLSQLDQCENPYSCPHGRPTVVRWPLSQFEKSFKRIA